MKNQVGFLNVVGRLKVHLFRLQMGLFQILGTSIYLANNSRALIVHYLTRIIFTVPPDILDYESSSDMVVREGSNVTFKCAASGSPAPTITWRKESGDPIAISGEREGF